jgi:predicted homoserine dehydrogenase-like protein
MKNLIPGRIGIVGTGFISCQLIRALRRINDLKVSAVFTRRSLRNVVDFPSSELLINSLDDLAEKSDIIVECSGDPRIGAQAVSFAFERGIPVVTMNSEFHVTCGSYFADLGWLSEAEGDQPGCTAALAKEVVAMGFRPLVYGNMKGFLEHNPSLESMTHWAKIQGISLHQVTAFTDGTKVQFEQALIANGLGATILKPGLLGYEGANRQEAAKELSRRAIQTGEAISDYLLDRHLPPGVFITALHDETESAALRYMKMGEGPFYMLERPYHLCGLEISKTLRQALRKEAPLLNNGCQPRVSVAAIAKRDLPKGYCIKRGMGGFDLRGEAVLIKDFPDHIPLGIIFDAILTQPVEAGSRLTWKDIEMPDSMALTIVRKLFSL